MGKKQKNKTKKRNTMERVLTGGVESRSQTPSEPILPVC
uniref:Uncharacterized protein n=1 Tax=Anguilla anguilla TaxID=7936 RepID=A0A0E9QKA8_ANGAN